MVSSEQKKSVIIIKRPIIGGAGHHGGSWKVAYADFVTAMMAFFLLMWLLNISPASKKKEIQEYFKTYSIVNGGGSLGSAASDAMAVLDGGKNCDQEAQLFSAKNQEELALVERDMSASLNRRMTGLEAGVSVHVVGSAVRVELSQQSLFESGGATLTPLGNQIVAAIGEDLMNLERPIEIEGHSDGVRFGNASYSNWDLSVDRALTIRRVFQTNNIKLEVRRVSGLADQMPLYPGSPGDPRNRRVTIVIPVQKRVQKFEVQGEQVPSVGGRGENP